MQISFESNWKYGGIDRACMTIPLRGLGAITFTRHPSHIEGLSNSNVCGVGTDDAKAAHPEAAGCKLKKLEAEAAVVCPGDVNIFADYIVACREELERDVPIQAKMVRDSTKLFMIEAPTAQLCLEFCDRAAELLPEHVPIGFRLR